MKWSFQYTRNIAIILIYLCLILESAKNTTAPVNCELLKVICNWNYYRNIFQQYDHKMQYNTKQTRLVVAYNLSASNLNYNTYKINAIIRLLTRGYIQQ